MYYITYMFNQPTQSSKPSRLSRASCHHINCILRVQDVLTSPGDSITAVVQPNNQHVNLSAVKQLCKKTIAVHLSARNVILLIPSLLLLSGYEYFTTRQNISSKNLTKNMRLRHFPNKTWKAYSKYIILRTPASPGTSAGLPQKQLPCVRICGGSMSWYHDATNAMDLSMVFCWRVWCIGVCLQNSRISCNKHLL